ncbi:eukaryotic translation initiation factor 3 subunit D [Folsomia candida]|uniref:eukaryotic translation initiation factor 3 subunit D n=1 Tax=Folsomia candida TaxID=158441 RepID=UPI000B8F4A1C|nr:eukaryotic translation initiation factor 3 subunit D [Folsomia candida]
MAAKPLAKFTPPIIHDNETGWGPTGTPEQFQNMPYQPFAKSDRLGKIADWTGATYPDRRFQNKYTSQFGVGAGNQFAYFHDEDESSFQLVDTTKLQRPMYQRSRFRPNQRNMRMRNQNSRMQPQGMQQLKANKMKDRRFQNQRGRGRYDNKGQMKNREASVTVKADWKSVEEMDFPRLSKLYLPNVKEPEDLVKCGSMEFYDKSYDRVNVKNERPLQPVDRIFHTVTTSDDPIIRKLSKTVGNVYATDSILATLMCATRSNYSWDIVVQKIGEKLFFDKRDNTFDLLTVNETSNEPPVDDPEMLNTLALEATFVCNNFSQQALKTGEDRYKFEDPNPFIGEEEVEKMASVGYRYRKWDLDNGIVLVTRCQHDAVMQAVNGEMQYINVKALNEWDPRFSGGIEWRQKLDSQRGAVLANELRNNACKLAKWTVQSLLAGSDQMKFGYVSRVSVRDDSNHVILGTQQFKPTEFATQISLNMDNAWGVLRCVIDLCMKQPDGKYLILRDPNKPLIHLFDIPDNTFESEEEDTSDEDGDREEN